MPNSLLISQIYLFVFKTHQNFSFIFHYTTHLTHVTLFPTPGPNSRCSICLESSSLGVSTAISFPLFRSSSPVIFLELLRPVLSDFVPPSTLFLILWCLHGTYLTYSSIIYFYVDIFIFNLPHLSISSIITVVLSLQADSSHSIRIFWMAEWMNAGWMTRMLQR